MNYRFWSLGQIWEAIKSLGKISVSGIKREASKSRHLQRLLLSVRTNTRYQLKCNAKNSKCLEIKRKNQVEVTERMKTMSVMYPRRSMRIFVQRLRRYVSIIIYVALHRFLSLNYKYAQLSKVGTYSQMNLCTGQPSLLMSLVSLPPPVLLSAVCQVGFIC